MKYEEKTLTRDSKFKGNIFEVAADEVLYQMVRRLVVSSFSIGELWPF